MYKILIVDDENLVRVAFRNMLEYEKLGFTVTATASDGVEALNAYRRYRPDVIITDLKMPNMDGIELIKALQEEGYEGKIIIISNYDDFAMVRSGLLLGAEDYLLKVAITPEDFGSLLEKLRVKLDLQADEKLRRGKPENGVPPAQDTETWAKFLLDTHNLPASRELKKILEYAPVSLFFLLPQDHSTFLLDAQQEETWTVDYAIRNVMTEILFPTHEAEVATLGMDMLFAVGRADKQNMLSDFAAQNLVSTLASYLNISSGVAYASSVGSMAQARECAAKLAMANTALFYGGEGAVVNLVKDIDAPVGWAFDNADIASSLRSGIRANNEQAYAQVVHTLLQECRRQNTAAEEVKMNCIDILTATVHLLELDVPTAQGDALYQKVAQGKSANVVERDLLEAIQVLHAAYRVKDENNYPQPVQEVIRFVYQHIQEKITLTQLAGHVNFNETYLSTLFKQHVGIGIVSYINQQKIYTAAEMLRRDGKLLKTIALDLGFSDQFYFARLFRRYIGMAPSEYRASTKNSANETKK